jgi:hypothetical protein
MLHESKVRRARSVHVEANLLHGVGDIRTRQSEILKRTSKTPVFSSIQYQVAISIRELGLSINGSW